MNQDQQHDSSQSNSGKFPSIPENCPGNSETGVIGPVAVRREVAALRPLWLMIACGPVGFCSGTMFVGQRSSCVIRFPGHFGTGPPGLKAEILLI